MSVGQLQPWQEWISDKFWKLLKKKLWKKQIFFRHSLSCQFALSDINLYKKSTGFRILNSLMKKDMGVYFNVKLLKLDWVMLKIPLPFIRKWRPKAAFFGNTGHCSDRPWQIKFSVIYIQVLLLYNICLSTYFHIKTFVYVKQKISYLQSSQTQTILAVNNTRRKILFYLIQFTN